MGQESGAAGASLIEDVDDAFVDASSEPIEGPGGPCHRCGVATAVVRIRFTPPLDSGPVKDVCGSCYDVFTAEFSDCELLGGES